MTTLNFVGGATPDVSTSWTAYSKVYSNTAANGVALPTTGRTDSNGNKPILVSTAQVYWAGRGGARQLRIGIGSTYSSWYTVGSDTSANASGQKTINGIYLNGGNQVVTIDENGSSGFYFGRATGSSGSTDGVTNWGSLSGSLVYYQVSNAPTSVSVAQSALENAVNVSWTAPSDNGGSAITSYSVMWSYSSSFTSSTTILTGSTATSHKITGLSYGSTVYVKVAASNAVSAAAGSTSVYSSSASAYITPPDLPLNGWAHFGTATSNTWSLDHTVIPALTPETGLLLTGTASATGGTYTTGAVGVEKTYTDLIIGRQYIVSGKAILRQAGVPANIYRFAVTSIGNGSSVTLTSTTVGATIPSYTFTATSTTHTVQIELAETFTVTATGVQESVAFYDYALTKVATDLPYRLQDNLETGSLVDHFDLATQSVGATWWVDKNNVTQFAQDFNYVFPTAVFSDEIADGNLYYSNIKTAYDTSAVINQITFNNIGVKNNQYGNAQIEPYEIEWFDSDTTSVAAWGARSFTLKTNLQTELTAQNLVPSPSVENQVVEYSTTNWNYSNEQPSLDSSGSWDAKDGLFALRARNNTGAGTIVNIADDVRMAVTPSTVYYGVAYGGTSNVTSARGRLRIKWLDDSGATISSSYGSQVNYTTVRTWYKVTVSATAPSNAVAATMDIESSRTTGAAFASGAKVWMDARYFGTANVSDWFDGNTTDTTTEIYSWDGSNNLSTSTRYNNTMDTRTGELLTDFATPVVCVSSLTWNTAQNPVVAYQIDIGSLIEIEFKGTTDTYRVVGINHDITPERWMMNLQVAKVV